MKPWITRARRAGARNVSTHEFGAADQLVHDLIDPEQPQQRVDYVYEVLTRLLDNAQSMVE